MGGFRGNCLRKGKIERLNLKVQTIFLFSLDVLTGRKPAIKTLKPLLDKSCRPVSLEEDKQIRAERMSEPPVFLESTNNLTVEEMTAIELEEETAGAKPQLSESSAAYLWLTNFINSFVSLPDFGSVIKVMEFWSDSMRGELTFDGSSLSYSKCQVTIDILINQGHRTGGKPDKGKQTKLAQITAGGPDESCSRGSHLSEEY